MHFLPAVSRFCRDVLSSGSSSVRSLLHSPFAVSFTSLLPISTSSYDGDDKGESVGHSVGTTDHLPEIPTRVVPEALLRVNAWLDSWRESDLYKKYEKENQDKQKSNSVYSSERLCSHLVGDDSGPVLGAGQSPNLASEAQHESSFELDADCVGDCSSAALDFSLRSDSYLVHPNGWNDAQIVEELFDRVSEGIFSYDPEEVHSQEWNPTCFTGEDNDSIPSVESGDHQYSSPQHQEYTEFTSGRFESDVVVPAYYTHLGRRSRSHAEITLEDTEGPGGPFDDESICPENDRVKRRRLTDAPYVCFTRGNLNQQRMPSVSSVIRSEPAFNPFAVEARDTEEDGIPLWALTHLRGETIRPQVSPRSLTHSEHVWLQEACDAWGAGRFGQPPWQGFVTSARNAEGIAHHSILEDYLETVSNYGGAEFFQSIGITHYIPYAERDVELPVQEEVVSPPPAEVGGILGDE